MCAAVSVQAAAYLEHHSRMAEGHRSLVGERHSQGVGRHSQGVGRYNQAGRAVAARSLEVGIHLAAVGEPLHDLHTYSNIWGVIAAALSQRSTLVPAASHVCVGLARRS